MQTDTDSRTYAAQRLFMFTDNYYREDPSVNANALRDSAHTLLERGWGDQDESTFLHFLTLLLTETSSQALTRRLLGIHRAYIAWARVATARDMV